MSINSFIKFGLSCLGLTLTAQLVLGQISAGNDTTINCNSSILLSALVVPVNETTDYTVNTISYNNDPYNQGTQLFLSDDIHSGVINIPFTFCFYGNTYTQLLIASNNYVTFDLTSASAYSQWPINNAVPSTSNPMNAAMGPWQDINPGVGGQIWYETYGTAPFRRFVVSYYQVPMFSCTSSLYTSQIKLFETTNIIETHIEDKPLCSSWNGGYAIHAVHNSTGTQAVVVSNRNYPTQWTTSNEGMQFIPNGPPAYTVSWSQNSVPIANTDTVTVYPITPTEYVASVNYICNNVTLYDTILVNASSLSIIGNSIDVTCPGGNNGFASVTPTSGSGPFTYSWTTTPVQTTSSATNLTAGTYTVTISDQNGCTRDTTITINEPPAFAIITTQSNLLCNQDGSGNASVAVSGATPGYSYSWNTTPVQTGVTAQNLSAGNYTVTIIDANNCQTTQNFIITEPAQLLATATGTNISCNSGSDGTVTANPFGGTPGYIYYWATTPPQTTQTATNLSAGTYIVTINDTNGCVTQAAITLTEPNVLTLSSSQTEVDCYNNLTGTATATPSGGTTPYSYVWNTVPVQNTQTATGLGFGNYQVLVTDANGCFDTLNFSISQPNALVVQSTGQTDNLCFGDALGIAGVSVSGGVPVYSYSWNTNPPQNSALAGNLPAGNYTVTVTDANGCQQQQFFSILQPPQIQINLQSQDVTCYGFGDGQIFSFVNGGVPGYSYTWNTNPAQNSQFATQLGPGNYVLTIQDQNGCIMTQNAVINEPQPLQTSVTGTNILCNGAQTGDATINVTGGNVPYTILWGTNPPQVGVTAIQLYAGTYYVEVYDSKACYKMDSITLTENPLLVATILSPDTICQYTDVPFSTQVSGGVASYQYMWYPNYGLDAYNIANPTLNIWEPTLYSLTVSDAVGCYTTIFYPVEMYEPVPALFNLSYSNEDHEVEIPDSAIFHNLSNPFQPQYFWNFGDGDTITGFEQNHYYETTGVYQVTLEITTINGCKTSYSLPVTVTAPTTLFFPNAFSPNGDGTNDFFASPNLNLTSLQISIFDRWGNQVFYSEDLNFKWDGAVAGNPLPEGVYTFTATGKTYEGKSFTRGGTITLIK